MSLYRAASSISLSRNILSFYIDVGEASQPHPDVSRRAFAGHGSGRTRCPACTIALGARPSIVRVSGLVLRLCTEAARNKRVPDGQGGSWGLASYGSGRPERRDLNRLKTTIG
jgi:hypothetical protein